MAQVHVAQTSSGFLPTLTWGTGANGDREAYAMPFDTLEIAERIARDWAEERGAEYVPFRPVDQDASRQFAELVKQIRDEDGLGLPAAMMKAREILASA